MDFSSAACDVSVLDVLGAIEDKLYERGILVTVTGDPESDVTISFKAIGVRNEQVRALVVSVTSVEARGLDESDWEGLSDYVNDEYLRLRAQLRKEVLEALEQSCGQYVTLNGRVVY